MTNFKEKILNFNGKVFVNGEILDVSRSKDSNIVEEADKLYESLNIEELYSLLKPFSDSSNADLVWRLARATSDKAKVTKDMEQKRSLLFDALGYAEKALKLDSSNFACHKWCGILLNDVGEFQDKKQFIGNLCVIRDHLKKAIELNPTDAMSIYSLGNWCYNVADLSWHERKIVSDAFDTPPSATIEEALSYFEQAEKVDPDFYSMNQLMIGKCYLKLNRRELANKYFNKTLDYFSKTDEDNMVIQLAKDFLK